MGVFPESFTLNLDGVKYGAYNSKLNDELCFTLSEYNYKKDASTVCGHDKYLKGVTSGNNAMSHPFEYSFWGRALDAINIQKSEQGQGMQYFSAFSNNTEKLPFVYKNYGLIPTPGLSEYSLYPLSAQKIFTVGDGEVYLKYDKKSDSCKYAFSETGTWTDLNNGPGVFFVMVGGGGSGANSTYALAGGGGGGGGSMMGYMDLRMMNSQVRFTAGKGGVSPGSVFGTDGISGSSSTLERASDIIQTSSGIKYVYQTIAICGGGAGGKYKSTAGKGGTVKKDFSDIGCNYLRIFDGWQGCDGGRGDQDITDATGKSYSSDIHFSMTFLASNYRPAMKNNSYGKGENAYKADSSHTSYGGGGGASFLSKPTGSSAGGYGCGGHGGSYKLGTVWTQGEAGTDGALLIAKLE